MKGFDSDWLKRHENRSVRPLPNPQPERHQAPALGGAIQGEKRGVAKTVVRFIGYRVHLLDPDNFAGSCKDLIDGLRHAGLLHDDTPETIKLETEQERVGHFCEERTVIEIEYP